MTTAAKPLALNSGKFYKTMLGEVAEILSLDMTDKTAFPLSAVMSDGRHTRVDWKGLTTCGDRLCELVPPVIPAAPVVSDYLSAAIDDELTLAALLHWQNFTKPTVITPKGWIRGTHNAYNGHVRNGSVPMPAWRRSWAGAGELISRCGLSIATSPAGVAVCAETGDTVRAVYSDHPSEDDAIRFAMCKAAIAYLRAKS